MFRNYRGTDEMWLSADTVNGEWATEQYSEMNCLNAIYLILIYRVSPVPV
jgi:hypothetical protein